MRPDSTSTTVLCWSLCDENQEGFQGTDEGESGYSYSSPKLIFEPTSWDSLMHAILTCAFIPFAYEANCKGSYLPAWRYHLWVSYVACSASTLKDACPNRLLMFPPFWNVGCCYMKQKLLWKKWLQMIS